MQRLTRCCLAGGRGTSRESGETLEVRWSLTSAAVYSALTGRVQFASASLHLEDSLSRSGASLQVEPLLLGYISSSPVDIITPTHFRIKKLFNSYNCMV